MNVRRRISLQMLRSFCFNGVSNYSILFECSLSSFCLNGKRKINTAEIFVAGAPSLVLALLNFVPLTHDPFRHEGGHHDQNLRTHHTFVGKNLLLSTSEQHCLFLDDDKRTYDKNRWNCHARI